MKLIPYYFNDLDILNSSTLDTSSVTLNFSSSPQTYVTAGAIKIQTLGKLCIISFVDVKISNNPTNNIEIITSDDTPKSKYDITTVLLDAYGNAGAQKLQIYANENKIRNYYSTDGTRKSGSFHGELVYIIA